MSTWGFARGTRFRYVAKVALAALTAFALALGGRNDYALFAALGAAMVVGGSFGEDLSSSLNRVRGTLAGTAVGIVSSTLLGGSIWSLGLTVAIIAWLSVGLGWGPAAMRIGLAMALVVLFMHTDNPLHYGLWRAGNTLMGVIIGLAVGRLVWPIRTGERIAAAIDRIFSDIAGALDALAQGVRPEELLARQVVVLDTLTAIRAARRDARVEQRLLPHAGEDSREALLAARAGIATLSASLRFGDLTLDGAASEHLQDARAALGALAAWARSGATSDAAAADFVTRHELALRGLEQRGLPAEARAALALLLDELLQLRAALQALHDARPVVHTA